MARQYFDDGSWIDTDSQGATIASSSAGSIVSAIGPDGSYYQSAGYLTDARESAKLDPYVPAPNGDSRPWWQRVAEYGLTRAIDNQYGPPAVNKTSTPATFAGQNGRTYSTAPNNGTASPAGGSGLGPLVLAGLAFVFLG